VPDGTGLGKPLKSSIRPLRSDIPIYLAAEGPKNIAMAGELCDGWLALFYSPYHDDFYREALQEGFDVPAPRRRSRDDFEVAATWRGDHHRRHRGGRRCAAPHVRAVTSAGWGARGTKLPRQTSRSGWATRPRSEKIQELYLSGDKDQAAAAVPTRLLEQLTLIGPRDKIRHDLEAVARVARHHHSRGRRAIRRHATLRTVAELGARLVAADRGNAATAWKPPAAHQSPHRR